MNKKQPTLFDTWNKVPLSSHSRSNPHVNQQNILTSTNDVGSPNLSNSDAFQPCKYARTIELEDPEFDYEAGKTWIYPTNYPIRDYQFSIVKEALFKNTLVVLPTGLGKTFIAAVVMYNIYRWYPNGKVVFMAPTKPLVAQQVDACFKITGISQDDTTQMTGTNAPELRKIMWLRKRVFFLTPQILVNDLVRNICPPSSIKCLVVDEAHKALGNHAYCQVIKELCNYTSQFRILALTATPGSEIQSVKQVLCNLLICHVEMRSEDSEDVQQYTHIRDIEKVVVPLGDRLNTLKSKFLDVINIYLKRLTLRKVMTSKNPASLSKFQILKLREMFSQHPPTNIDKMTYGLSMADFSVCISLYHAYELLLLHGATSFYNFLTGILSGEKSIPHTRSELLKNLEFKEIMQEVKENYIPEQTNQNLEGKNLVKQKSILPGHPKLEKLLEVVLNHFKSANRENISDTRVMIFTQYRDSVQEIVNMLNQHQPIVKVMSFIGQSSKSMTNAGFSQKQQLKVIQQFRSGGYNTLVSTCVGEEGLDIGEVDLIVCYDCPKSPIRLVQRMGRTGRLRKGRIIILIAEGKEEQMYNSCEYRKKTIHRALTKGFSFAQFYQNSPSIIPPGVKPMCVKTTVTIEPKKVFLKTTTKSPYLTEEEMAEYEKHVKISSSNAPLFPKRECIILKRSSEKVFEDASCDTLSVKPQFSLSEWTLWQTTPQRTHFIPHSSKSLLLPKILEHIHFPELIASKNTSLNLSSLSDFPKQIINSSKVHDEFYTSFKQSKITDLLSTSKIVEDFHKHDFIDLTFSPEKERKKINIPVFKSINAKAGLPLLQQLFNIHIPQSSNFSNNCLILPPSSVCLSNIADFSLAVENSDKLSNKTYSVLFVLNKKMKAKIKRKSKELGRNLSFTSHSSKLATPTKRTSVSPTQLKNECNNSAFGISFAIPCSDICQKSNSKQSSIFNEEEELKALSFDVDFDLPDDIDSDTQAKCNAKTVLNTDFDISEINNFELGINMCSNSEEAKEIAHLKNDWEFILSKKYNDLETFELQEIVKSPTLNACVVNKSSSNKNLSTNLCHFETELKETYIQNKSEDLRNKNNRILSSSSKSNYMAETSQKTCVLKECFMSDKCVINSLVVKSKDNASNLAISPVQQFESRSSELQDKGNLVYLQELNESGSFQNMLPKYGLNKTSCDLNLSSNSVKNKLSLLENVNSIDTICDFDKTLVVSEKFDNSCVESKGTLLNSLCVNMEETNFSEKNKIENNSGEHRNQFEAPFSVEIKNSSDSPISSSDVITEKCMPKASVITNNLEEFDEDANSILEQLFTSQKSVSSNIDCSFSSPLTLKRCISQTEDDGKKILMNCKKHVKTSKNTFKSPNALSTSLFKIPSVQKDMNFTTDKLSCKQNFNFKINESIGESSQYSMTQLLSLIDCTGKLEKKSKNSPRTIQNCSDVVSSEDEVCPTPPKEEIKTKSKFVYSKKTPVKKSLIFGSFVKMHDDHAILNRNALNIKSNISTHSISKLPNFQNNPLNSYVEINQENRFDKSNSIATKQSTTNGNCIDKNKNTFRDIESEQMDKITFDVSFDLPFTQENLDISTKDESFDMNKAIYIESSSKENQLDESLSNDGNLVIYFESKNNNLNFEQEKENILKSLNSDENVHKTSISDHVTDEITFADSESLLPAKQIEGYKLNFESLASEVHKDDLINQENIQMKEKYVDKSCTAEKNVNSPFSNGLGRSPFESTIFFELLSPKNCISKSNYDLGNAKCLSNFNKDKRKECINSLFTDKKSVDAMENFIHSNSYSSAQDKLLLSNQSNSQLYVNQEPKSIYCNKSPVNQCLDSLSIHVNKTSSEMTPTKNKVLFSKKRLVFDSEDNNDDDDEETCVLLPNIISTIIEIDSEKEFKKNSKAENQNICSTMHSENLDSSKPETETKNIESKKIFKNVIFKSAKICNISPDKQFYSEKSFDDLNAKYNKNMNEFDLDKEKSSLEKIGRYKDASPFYKVPNIYEALDDKAMFSDESDFCDDEQSSIKLRKQYEDLKLTKSCIGNCDIASNKLCSSHKDSVNIKDKLQSTKDKLNKLPSKFSVKNRAKSLTKNILRNNTFVEEEEAFQFIRKVDRKTDMPGNKKRKRKVASGKNEFLLTQAEVSGGEDSDRELDIDDDDDIHESFINDESPEKMDYTDQHAFYLRSLKNSVGMPKQFKLKSLKKNYSHSKTEAECSNYMFDSFCVNDEDVIFLSSDDDSEFQKKSKNKRIEKVENRCKKLRRIIIYDSTTSSEHEESPKIKKISNETACITDLPSNHDESVIAAKKCKPNIRISSDEEEDNFVFIKPVTLESHIPENALSDVNKINIKTSVKDSSNLQKIEFSLDFFDNDVDFIPLSTTRKTQTGISMNVVNASENKYKSCTNKYISEVRSADTSTNCDLNHKDVLFVKNLDENISKVPSEMPSCSKMLDSKLITKSTKCASEIDFNSVNNIAFDIGWNEFTPCVSNDIKNLENTVVNGNNSIFESLNYSKASIILVSSCELASGKPVISALRSMHNVNPVVMQLNSADYVISNRVAIERVLDSEFNNCSMPPRIVEKIKSMNEIYEKSVVIIERDNRKHILSFNKNTTKFLQFVCHLNYHPSTKVLLSKSVENTSELISNLIIQERKRGFHINVPVTLNPKNQKLYDFYASFPKISPICALNFVYYFPSIELFSKSSVEDLKIKGCIPSRKAAKIFKYFRSELTYDKNL